MRLYLQKLWDLYDSHQHIDALHVFTPHLKIHPSTSKRFRKIYEANLLNDYKT